MKVLVQYDDIGSDINAIVSDIMVTLDDSDTTLFTPYQTSTTKITKDTEFPVTGLKSFNGVTNIVSPGNVKVTYAKSEIGAVILNTSENKLDKDDIVNNQTTTVAGFALDARQANPNIDGSLAKQISDLNGSLNDLNNFKFRKVIDNWSSSSQVSGGCGIYKINTIEDKFYNLISKNVTTFKNVGDYTLIIFSWNGLETLNYSSGLLTTPRSTTFCFVRVWDGDFILYDV